MLRRADAARRRVNLARVGLGIDDQLGHGLGRYRRMKHDKVGDCANTSNRRDVADKIEIELVVERRVDCVRGTNQEKRVTIRRRAYDRVDTDIAAAARPVLDDELLPEPLRQPLSYQARDDVGSTSGGNSDHDDDRPCVTGLRPTDSLY